MTDFHYGYAPERWESMVDAGLTYLEQLAATGGHCDYTTFCREVARVSGSAPQPGDHALASLLGDIGRRSYEHRGVVVTALVHYKDEGFSPGPGFYSLCQELGLLSSGKLTDNQMITFLAGHQQEIEATYQRPRRRG
jgi:hypothetical protein